MIWGSILSLLKKAQCCKIDPLLMSSTFLEYNYFHPCKNKYSQAFGESRSLYYKPISELDLFRM